MANEIGSEVIRNLQGFRKALKYLDSCGELTLDKLRKVAELQGGNLDEAAIQHLWQMKDMIMPRPGESGGAEFVRIEIRKTLVEGIKVYEALANKLGVSIPREEESTNKACFIATACYGCPNAPEVVVLRNFRDEVLLTSAIGTQLVNCYYSISPPIARQLSRHPAAAKSLRALFLAPLITLIRNRQR
jgi:hypothetical protein